MRHGIVLFTSDRGSTPAAAAQAAEAAGFDTFHVPEHTHIPVKREAPHPRTGDSSLPDDRYLRTLDPWVALATAASVTTRIRLATAVALPVESDPITLAKTIASLDHLSAGRVTLGVGFGWNIDELTDHGVPAGKRRTVLREYLEAMRALWTDDEASYAGEFVSFGASWAWPKPAQARIPVIVGAGGTEKTFRWIAKSADGWLTTPGDTDIEGKARLLREIWHEAGRDGEPEISALGVRPDPENLAGLEAAGVTETIFGLPDRSPGEVEAWLQRLAGKLGLSAGNR
ncbi:LLM class F420-dependent oxidoreductase [Amycolatopsis regifaucium]|uniref:LLM class F420-dependent oxidoreductase n=1 Tax=Amycolatopsis regifaucium TaxID=546365 RepID=A0A154M6A6_9PSEU|nr:LLM class F420-dependent oxidoreductase [Amycolatopsis regifaucium]KZB79389.1 LLM class F420-dependent oxidoreductase [Amycolatopsis regifaucium]OKA07571.1 LLM class F420-dependent oxidoreductase [Amycolatopsis regifaucium]SFH08054.1 probable F420-dependent oxidoreductase, Rv2161c family [Amycolatopsis regifaucium]